MRRDTEALGQSARVVTSAGPLLYRDAGDGPPVIFLQGLLTGPQVWDGVVPALSSHYRCITVDWPFGAHPGPMRPDADLSPPGLARLVVEFLGLLGLPSATLVGSDSGGVICQLVIAEQPEMVDAAVLVACDAFECFPPDAYKFLFRAAAVPATAWLMAQLLRSSVIRRSRFGFGPVLHHTPDRDMLRRWAGPIAADRGVRRDLSKLMRGSSAMQTTGAAERFPEFAKPVMVVWANEDQLFPADLGRRLAAAFPAGHFEMVDDSATFISIDQPGCLTALIQQFLSSAIRPTPQIP